MKFFILASLFVLSVFAEPEAKSDAQRYNYGVYGDYQTGHHGYYGHDETPSYSPYNFNYNHFNPSFNGHMRFVRESEAEPEAEAQYGYYPSSMTYGYSGYPYNYNHYNSFYNNRYNPTFFGQRRFVREAEAEPKAESDSQRYNYGFYGDHQAGHHGYYENIQTPFYNPYNPTFFGQRRFVREAESEPKAKSDAQRYNYGFYGDHQSGQHGYYENIQTPFYSPYNPTFFGQRRFVREAEAEPKAKSDAQRYNYGFYGDHQTGHHGYYENFQPPSYSPYNFNFNSFNGHYRY